MASNKSSYARLFQRHAHPFSAWSRLLSAPLLLVPLWTRRWWLYVPIGAWFAVNPVMTPPAHNTSSFATRAILGEESWTRDPTSEPRVLALTGAATASLVGAMVASYQHRKTATVAGAGSFVALTLWQWKLWADRFTRENPKAVRPRPVRGRTRRGMVGREAFTAAMSDAPKASVLLAAK